MAKVKIDGLADAIIKELSEYNQEVTDGVKQEVKSVANDVTDKPNTEDGMADYLTKYLDL